LVVPEWIGDIAKELCMQFDDTKRREQIALFRYGVIADLIHLPRGKGGGLYDKLREKSERDYSNSISARSPRI
jgi:hypothetical protein